MIPWFVDSSPTTGEKRAAAAKSTTLVLMIMMKALSFCFFDLFCNMWTHTMERRFRESTTPSHSTHCNTWKSMYGSEGEHVDKVMRYSSLTGAPRTTLTPTAVAKIRTSRQHCAPRHGCEGVPEHGNQNARNAHGTNSSHTPCFRNE